VLEGGNPVTRRLRAIITFEVDFMVEVDGGSSGSSGDPVDLARRYRRELFRHPFAYWSAEQLCGERPATDVVEVDRHVEVEAAPVGELHPEQVGMRLWPRRPEGWAEWDLCDRFLNRQVQFTTVDGRLVSAMVASIGGWSVEVASARAEHPPGYGPFVSLWVPELGQFTWANPESLTVVGGWLPTTSLGPVDAAGR
jgi:hypothetical protein